ncbi:hypothetical protein MMC17_003961 [Xylographa soralifera]|nr:hypothetical protein [Xylographa soralifera]
METLEICCQVCHRPGTSVLSLNCATCARNALYEPRLQHVQSLLRKEALGREVEQALTAGKGPRKAPSSTHSSARVTYENATSQLSEVVERTKTVSCHADILQNQGNEIRLDIAKRRAAQEERRIGLTSAKRDLAEQERKAAEPTQKAIVKTKYTWDNLHAETVKSRVFLCREVASLYGLQQKKRRKGVSGRDTYLIGGVPIVDIRDINSKEYVLSSYLPKKMAANRFEDTDPLQITVSTAYLAHLLHLTSHYLAVRLPAEISLPNTAHPYSQIFSPLSSYNNPAIPYPPTKLSPSSSTSNASRITSRARPLYLDKPPLSLATEDPIAYALFIEAITLLAWDVAWLCKTQGLDVSTRSWEDVCAMGKNMWLLFVAPPIRPAISRATSTKTDATTETGSTNTTPSTKPPVTKRSEITQTVGTFVPLLGHFSHGTNHSFLNAAEGSEYMRNWKLASPMRVIQKVKDALVSARMGADWEVLEEGEWEGEALEREEAGKAAAANTNEPIVPKPLLGGKTAESGSPKLGSASPAGGIRRTSETQEEGREKGRSGWMKVKSRGVDG